MLFDNRRSAQSIGLRNLSSLHYHLLLTYINLFIEKKSPLSIIKKIIKKHEGERGVIHTHSYARTKRIVRDSKGYSIKPIYLITNVNRLDEYIFLRVAEIRDPWVFQR